MESPVHKNGGYRPGEWPFTWPGWGTNVVTPDEIASIYRNAVWPIITTNLSPSKRMYDYDETWIQYKIMAVNHVIPAIRRAFDSQGLPWFDKFRYTDLNGAKWVDNELMKEQERYALMLQRKQEGAVKEVSKFEKSALGRLAVLLGSFAGGYASVKGGV